MHFVWDFNIGNALTIATLICVFFSKSGRWFVAVDKRLVDLDSSLKKIRQDIDRNGRNAYAIKEYLERIDRILINKYPEAHWPEINWMDQNND